MASVFTLVLVLRQSSENRSNKKQRVVVGGFVTKFVSVNRAVPQGTVRGPVLFSVMVNDITPVDPERNLLVQILVKYAGDLSYA